MQDLIYVAGLIAFFALTALFVVGCDRIIGPDEEALAEDEGRTAPEPELVHGGRAA